MDTCVTCGQHLDPDATFCAFCGTPNPAHPAAPAEPRAGKGIGLLGLLGVAAVLVGSVPIGGLYLGWLSLAGAPASAWDLSLGGILSGRGGGGGIPVGAVLLVVVVNLAPLFTRKPLPGRTSYVTGAVAATLAGVAMIRGATAQPPLDPGPGLALTFIGGVLLVAADLLGPGGVQLRAARRRAPRPAAARSPFGAMGLGVEPEAPPPTPTATHTRIQSPAETRVAEPAPRAESAGPRPTEPSEPPAPAATMVRSTPDAAPPEDTPGPHGDEITCRSCGASISAGSRFCEFCGTTVG